MKQDFSLPPAPKRPLGEVNILSLIHISEPTRH